jgi:hypothetical protein
MDSYDKSIPIGDLHSCYPISLKLMKGRYLKTLKFYVSKMYHKLNILYCEIKFNDEVYEYYNTRKINMPINTDINEYEITKLIV